MGKFTPAIETGSLARQVKGTAFRQTLERLPCLNAAIHDWREFQLYPERLTVIELMPADASPFRRLLRLRKIFEAEVWAHASTTEFGGRIVRVTNDDLHGEITVARALIQKFQFNAGHQQLPMRTIFIVPTSESPNSGTVRIYVRPADQEQNLNSYLLQAAL